MLFLMNTGPAVQHVCRRLLWSAILRVSRRGDFNDIGHTLYSVEPYQGINGCRVPSGCLADSSNSKLSHEYFEIIFDPDVQTNVDPGTTMPAARSATFAATAPDT